MRRLAIKLVLFLLLGAIVNVAVAWVLPLWSRSQIIAAGVPGKDIPSLHAMSPISSAFTARAGMVDQSLGSERLHFFDHLGYPEIWRDSEGKIAVFYINSSGTWRKDDWPIDRGQCVLLRAGFPLFSLDAEYWEGPDLGLLPGAMRARAFRSAIELPSSYGDFIPYGPIWPGFAINTIFYAAVLWIIFAIPGGVKRLRRRAKGWCIHCGYDLRGQSADSKKCPECGRTTT
jgi:hypothetical protein